MSQSQPPAAPNPAQAYEDYFVPSMFRPWSEELLARANPQPGEQVLDVACGTGIVARLIAQRLGAEGRIAGLDLSPAMIEVARASAESEGAAIEWHVGSADALPFADAVFNLVTIQQGLQFFPDPAAGLREVHRVLVPGGRVVTATWTEIANNPFHQALADVIQQHLGTPAMHTPFSLGNEDQLRALFDDVGFASTQVERVRRTVRFSSPSRFVELGVAGAAAAVPALQSLDAAGRASLIDAVRADMEGPLEQYTDGDEIIAPMETHVVVALKDG